MKCSKVISAAVLSMFVMAGVSWSAEGPQTYQLKNRLRVEYDDNIYETRRDKTDSWKIIEELELLLNLNFEQTFLGLRYRPSFVWWDNRKNDDTDWHHDFDLVFSHNFTPRLSLSIKDTLRIAENPELIEGGAVVRENNDFTYNILNGVLSYLVQPQTRVEASGRYTLLRYDDNSVSDIEDYDIYAAGLTLRHQLKASTAVLGDLRVEDVNYDGPDRDSTSQYVGLGLEQIFSPNLLGSIRAGYQHKDFDASGLGSESSPYADGSITYLPSPATRITAGAGYSMFEADVFPFANQNRTLIYASIAHDLTARISLYIAGSYQLSEYDADDAIGGGAVTDGDEEIWQFSTRASYKLNRSNWLELGWQYLTLDSDLRDDFDRNRFDIGWRTVL
jgi:hypothetical protein